MQLRSSPFLFPFFLSTVTDTNDSSFTGVTQVPQLHTDISNKTNNNYLTINMQLCFSVSTVTGTNDSSFTGVTQVPQLHTGAFSAVEMTFGQRLVVQRYVTRLFCEALEFVHKPHFAYLCNVTLMQFNLTTLYNAMQCNQLILRHYTMQCNVTS
jgi:hypothetical protein